ncbi:MAG: DUF1573 domain-containing protein, partial [Chitinophagales bacterium]
MKNTLILMGFMLILGFSRGQVAPTAGTQSNAALAKPETLTLKETGHNFGKIPQGRPATYIFEIMNNGQEPLRLDNVQASCGCTTPEWSKEPIA